MDKVALERHMQRDPRCAIALMVAYAQWAQRHERAFARLIPREIRVRLAASLLELADRLESQRMLESPSECLSPTKRSPT